MTNPFVHIKRKRFTPYDYARCFAKCEGRCYECGRKLRPGDDYDMDHITALENGGTNEDDNLAIICKWCHVEKTADDHSMAGHARRTYTKHHVPSRFRRSRAWGNR